MIGTPSPPRQSVELKQTLNVINMAESWLQLPPIQMFVYLNAFVQHPPTSTNLSALTKNVVVGQTCSKLPLVKKVLTPLPPPTIKLFVTKQKSTPPQPLSGKTSLVPEKLGNPSLNKLASNLEYKPSEPSKTLLKSVTVVVTSNVVLVFPLLRTKR